ncbi:MAG: cell division protein ZapB [Desulfobacterales bacterium]|nr:cell division protein ZapB [Desulfobacterales bacterium]
MDEDTTAQQFKKVEERVEKLVDMCRELQRAKTELEVKIRDLEEALKTKNGIEQRCQEEKSMIRSKIDNLLSRLDQALDST